ncbi:phosphatidylinositol 3-kinase, putative [Eimeria tenella]|uniref:Phosphatidylinositol 3-kinase, putative n=1 Tax=Eimeria tenella TaxID=5802 RepID=U6KJ73_EIMTE|nr:phosphatidylinositol 3-kinase, putative [Eimeria tenella]CDJ38085.1 phosphatidylinositol 3-kinase, putative [Eimeria tenella]|eukprot:XP_013228923.1 phosphatidylinositol 3-kinase, putative [Eimeria tenella]
MATATPTPADKKAAPGDEMQLPHSSSSNNSGTGKILNSSSRLLSSTSTCRVPLLLKGEADSFVAVNVGGLVAVPSLRQKQQHHQYNTCCSRQGPTENSRDASFFVSAALFIDGHRAAPPCLLVPPMQQQSQHDNSTAADTQSSAETKAQQAASEAEIGLWPRPCLHSLIGFSHCGTAAASAAATTAAESTDAASAWNEGEISGGGGRTVVAAADTEGTAAAAACTMACTAAALPAAGPQAEVGNEAAAAAQGMQEDAETVAEIPEDKAAPAAAAEREAEAAQAPMQASQATADENGQETTGGIWSSSGCWCCSHCGINYVSLQQLVRLPAKISALPLNALLLFGVYIHDDLATAVTEAGTRAAAAARAEVAAVGDGWRLFGVSLLPLHDAAACVRQGRRLLPIHLLQQYLPLLPSSSKSAAGNSSTELERRLPTVLQQQELTALREATLPLSLQRLQRNTEGRATATEAESAPAAVGEPFRISAEAVLSILCAPSLQHQQVQEPYKPHEHPWLQPQQQERQQPEKQPLLERVEVEAAAVRCCRLLDLLQSGTIPPAAETVDAAAQRQLQQQLQQHLLLLQQLAQADYEEVWRRIASAEAPPQADCAAATTATGVPFGGYLYVELPSYGLPLLHGELRVTRAAAPVSIFSAASGAAGLQQQRQQSLLMQQPLGINSKISVPFPNPPRLSKAHAAPPVAPAEAAKLLLLQQQHRQQEAQLQKRQQHMAEQSQLPRLQLRQADVQDSARPKPSTSTATAMETAAAAAAVETRAADSQAGAPAEAVAAGVAAVTAAKPAPRNWLSRTWGIAPLAPRAATVATAVPPGATAASVGQEAGTTRATGEEGLQRQAAAAQTRAAAHVAANAAAQITALEGSQEGSVAAGNSDTRKAAYTAAPGAATERAPVGASDEECAEQEQQVQLRQLQLQQLQQQRNWKLLLRNPSVAERLQRRLLIHDASCGVTHPAAARVIQPPVQSTSFAAAASQLPPAAVARVFQRGRVGVGFSEMGWGEERTLLWSYRHHLLRVPFALPRLLQTVDWSASSNPQQQQQQQEALELLQLVDPSRLSVEEILGLLLFSQEVEPAAAAAAAEAQAAAALAEAKAAAAAAASGSNTLGTDSNAGDAFESSNSTNNINSNNSSIAAAVHAKVKELAVQGLDVAPEEDLLFFMQQLVQLIRTDQHVSGSGCRLVGSLIRRSLKSPSLALCFYWLLQSGKEHSADGHLYVRAEQRFLDSLRRRRRRGCSTTPSHHKQQQQGHDLRQPNQKQQKREQQQHQDRQQSEQQHQVHPRIQQQAEMAEEILQLLERQRALRSLLLSLNNKLKARRERVDKRSERLRLLLQRLCRDGFASLFPLAEHHEGPQYQQQEEQKEQQAKTGASTERDTQPMTEGSSQGKTAAAGPAATDAAETAEAVGAAPAKSGAVAGPATEPKTLSAGQATPSALTTPAVPAVAPGAPGLTAGTVSSDQVTTASEESNRINALLQACLRGPGTAAEAAATAAAAAEAAAEFGIPLPFDCSSVLLHIVAEDCYVMKSSQYPLVIKALTYQQQHRHQQSSNQRQEQQQGVLRLQRFLYKADDDLRQDVLVLQLVSYMNKILLKYGLDLKLTPYKARKLYTAESLCSNTTQLGSEVVAFSSSDGLIEFLEGCVSFAQVKRDNKSLLSYLESVHSSSSSAEELKRNFLASCAGYCVATYLLGVGDRHLDNLLLRKDGKMLHIDFGFILGEDPKPFAPPMKICREMVEVLGSVDSAEFAYFLHLCCLCFKYLRMHAYPICLLLECMATSSLKDIAKNLVRLPDKQQELQIQNQLLQQQQVNLNGASPPPPTEASTPATGTAAAAAGVAKTTDTAGELAVAAAATLVRQQQQQQYQYRQNQSAQNSPTEVHRTPMPESEPLAVAATAPEMAVAAETTAGPAAGIDLGTTTGTATGTPAEAPARTHSATPAGTPSGTLAADTAALPLSRPGAAATAPDSPSRGALCSNSSAPSASLPRTNLAGSNLPGSSLPSSILPGGNVTASSLTGSSVPGSSSSGRLVCLAIERVKARFHLDLTDEEAEQALVGVILSSAGALFPAVVDRLHEWAIYWK